MMKEECWHDEGEGVFSFGNDEGEVEIDFFKQLM